MTSLGFYWTDWRVFSRVTSCDSQPVNTYVKLSLGDKNGLYTERNLPAPRKTSQKANYLEELYGKQLGDGWKVCVFLWVLIREGERVHEWTMHEGEYCVKLGSSILDIDQLYLKPECGAFEYNPGECTILIRNISIAPSISLFRFVKLTLICQMPLKFSFHVSVSYSDKAMMIHCVSFYCLKMKVFMNSLLIFFINFLFLSTFNLWEKWEDWV